MTWHAQTYFEALADDVLSKAHADEVATLYYQGEASDFVRLNNGRVRQAGHVRQQGVTLRLFQDARQAAARVTLAGVLDTDRSRVRHALAGLRQRVAALPEDPHVVVPEPGPSTEQHGRNELPQAADAVDDVLTAAGDADLVGIFAAGPMGTGFASTRGQRNWFERCSYNLDWSLYLRDDKAVKCTYAGSSWASDDLTARMDAARTKLGVLDRTPVRIEPGAYRVYLAPAAVGELMDLLSRGGFSVKAHRTKQTPLLRMIDAGACVDPSFHVTENTADGLAPNFQEDGVVRPDRVSLIVGGAAGDPLVSPRSAREFGLASNGASNVERPESMDVASGTLAAADVAATVGTGIYIGNLWYTNFSDRSACRTTGMTRFATFWVDGGEIQAPLDVMRFDETFYRAFGSQLVGLTAERDWLIDPGTYGGRSAFSIRAPGAVIDDFSFTL